MMLWICLVMFSNAAAVQDMTGKVFFFPEESNSAHVTLKTEHNNFGVGTLCHRSFTELARDHVLFFLATPSNSQISTSYNSRDMTMLMYMESRYSYGRLDYSPNKWYFMCTTWKVETGQVQLWLNGRPMMKKFIPPDPSSASYITGQPQIVLGQDPGNHGGRFMSGRSFVGIMTDVHMWDHELSACEIQNYMQELPFTPGNIINWAALDFQISGNVLVENRIQGCDSKWIK